jgi:monoterpene epsilon-lactone hydrolase
MSLRRRLLQPALRALKLALSPRVPVRVQRVLVAAALQPFPSARGVVRNRRTMAGVPLECLRRKGRKPEHTILFLHGGGYCVGSPAAYRAITTRLARLSGAEIIVPDYRLAPEHPHPAALDDAVRVYRGLLDEGRAPARLIVAGDSAGGGLSLALALELRARDLPLPAALATISPWVDLALRGDSIVSRAARDPLLSQAAIAHWSALYRGRPGGTLAADAPACSPLYADLRGLPPLLIQVGSEEILHDDALRLAAAARAAGVTVTLREFAGLWHDFHLQAGVLADADAALAELVAYCHAAWPAKPDRHAVDAKPHTILGV